MRERGDDVASWVISSHDVDSGSFKSHFSKVQVQVHREKKKGALLVKQRNSDKTHGELGLRRLA